MLRNVYYKRGLRNQLEVNAIIIKNSGRMERLSWDIGLGQFAPKPGSLYQFSRSDVIWVGIGPVGRKNPPGLGQSKQPR